MYLFNFLAITKELESRQTQSAVRDLDTQEGDLHGSADKIHRRPYPESNGADRSDLVDNQIWHSE